MTAHQLGLFGHRFAEVDIMSNAYRAGFSAGHGAPRIEPEPERPPRWTDRRWRGYLAGWLDSRVRSAVPDWRLPTQPKETP